MLSAIADARTRGDVVAGAARALTNGFDLAFGVGAVFALAGALVAVLLLRRPPSSSALEAAPTGSLTSEDVEVLAA